LTDLTADRTPTTFLTQEAYDRLKAELETLSGPGRAEIVARIESAREEGDLRENGGYHAAKEEQGKVVEVKFGDDPDRERFLIGSREDTSTAIEVYSAQSPLGAAVVGHGVGDTVEYQLPNGRKNSVTITGVEPYTG
jgi:transcription elongation factor GreA